MNETAPCSICHKPTDATQTCEACGKVVCPECERNDENLLHVWCGSCAEAQVNAQPPELAEWQKHVRRTDGSGLSWCGQRLDVHNEWCFQEADHAILSVFQGQRLQPCPACGDVMMAQLRRVDRGAFPPLAETVTELERTRAALDGLMTTVAPILRESYPKSAWAEAWNTAAEVLPLEESHG